LKAGKPIRYEGVIGPVSFDQYGDITGPFRLWKIVDGKVTTVGEMRRQRDQGEARQVKERVIVPAAPPGRIACRMRRRASRSRRISRSAES
jgi:hypothetical protein